MGAEPSEIMGKVTRDLQLGLEAPPPSWSDQARQGKPEPVPISERSFVQPTDHRRPWHPEGRWYRPFEPRTCHHCGEQFEPGDQGAMVNWCATCAPRHPDEDAPGAADGQRPGPNVG